MRSPKRLIPQLAAATLPLTGISCGDSPPERLASSSEALCLKLESCVEDYDLQECLADSEEAVESYSLLLRDECINALASYLDCLYDLSCEDLADEQSEEFMVCNSRLERCGL